MKHFADYSTEPIFQK